MGWISILTQHWTVSQIEFGIGTVLALKFILGVILRWIAAAALLFFSFQSGGLLTGLTAIGGLFLARWWALVYFTRRI